MDVSADSQIEEVIAAFYVAFDNRGLRVPAGNDMARLFAASAVVMRVAGGRIESWSSREFIEPRMRMLTDGTLTDFHEWETDAQTTVRGNIASRVSTYQKIGNRGGAVYEGWGTKLIHLHRHTTGWVIGSILWEDAEDLVPEGAVDGQRAG